MPFITVSINNKPVSVEIFQNDKVTDMVCSIQELGYDVNAAFQSVFVKGEEIDPWGKVDLFTNYELCKFYLYSILS